MNNREDILRRVRVMLEHAKQKQLTSPNEAAAYSAKAQQLILEYNLELHELQKTSAQKDEITRVVVKNDKGVWGLLLLSALARGNFCDVIKTGKHLHIFGKKVNIELTQSLYEYLVNELVSMATNAYAEYIFSLRNPLPARSWKDNFYRGAVSTIRGRLEQQMQEFESRGSVVELEQLDGEAKEIRSHSGKDIKALVLASSSELEQKIAQTFPKVRTKTHKLKKARYDGYDEGIKAGSQVAINQLVE